MFLYQELNLKQFKALALALTLALIPLQQFLTLATPLLFSSNKAIM